MVVSCSRYLQCGDVDWLRTKQNFCVCTAFFKQQTQRKRNGTWVPRATGGGVGRAGNQVMKVILRSRVPQAKGSVKATRVLSECWAGRQHRVRSASSPS